MGLSSLKALDPVQPVVCYEREAPGELLHMDTKKLGRIVRPSHRLTGDRRDSVDGAGWEFAHVAIDDHSRASFVQILRDERKESVVEFLKATVMHYKSLGVTIKRLLTDNGSAYRSKLFARTCQALGIKHTFTKPYRLQTNGKAERFIQTCLREWAYGRVWSRSPERTAWLPAFLAYYNAPGPIRPSATSLQLPDSVGRTYCNSTGAFPGKVRQQHAQAAAPTTIKTTLALAIGASFDVIMVLAKARRLPTFTMLTCDSTQSPILAVPTKSMPRLVVNIRSAGVWEVAVT